MHDPATTGPRPRSGVDRWLWVLVLVHLAWGVARLPGKVFAQRLDEVAAFRAQGAEQWFFAAGELEGAQVVRWLRENTPAHSVVLWEGERLGAMEFAAALLSPRLFVPASRYAGVDRHADRPIATAALDGREGRVVVIATRQGLRLEVR